MPDWSIKIVPSSSGQGGAFVPDLKGAQQGDPLKAQEDDLVTWNNTTDQQHQPWPTDVNYNPYPDSDVQRGSANYLSDVIAPGASSRPSYDVGAPSNPTPAAWTVFYFCKLHPNVTSERGTISATAAPAT